MIESRKGKHNERILKIPMWSQLNKLKSDNERSSIALHKTFLYQMASALDTRKGSYICKRLSSNYGELQINVENIVTKFFASIAITLFIFGICIRYFQHKLAFIVGDATWISDVASLVSLAIAILIFVVILSKKEITYSKKGSDRKYVIESDEIIDLYRSTLIHKCGKFSNRLLNAFVRPLTKRKKIYKFFNSIYKGLNKIFSFSELDDILVFLERKKYIVVIEDLDRTDNNKAIIEFLMELRKYYIPECENNSRTTDIIFIVNIKSETDLIQCHKDNSCKDFENILESNDLNNNKQQKLYSKLFDFVLDLDKINFLDYDVILNGLLELEKEKLKQYPFYDENKAISDIEGIQWIIRGKNLTMREIKHRLNVAFTIYETLINRFENQKNEISFEKCVIAAYIKCAFEENFHSMKDDTFDILLDRKFKDDFDIETINNEFEFNNIEYTNEICTLIKENLIGEDYRLYFYNYPQNSKIYAKDEMLIRNLILYNEEFDDIEKVARDVIDKSPNSVYQAFEKLQKLKLPIPYNAYIDESLFIYALHNFPQLIYNKFTYLNITENTLEQNIDDIVRVLSYGFKHNEITPEVVKDFYLCWEKSFDKQSIIKLREVLCTKFSNKILYFKDLFFGTNNIISIYEMEQLSLEDSIKLINIDSVNFKSYYITNLITFFCNQESVSDEQGKLMENFLIKANKEKTVHIADVAEAYLLFMSSLGHVIPSLMKSVYLYILSCYDGYNRDNSNIPMVDDKKKLLFKYQDFINEMSTINLSTETISQVDSIIKKTSSYRYVEHVVTLLNKNGFNISALLLCAYNDFSIVPDKSDIESAIKSNKWWIENKDKFLNIRMFLLEKGKNVLDYTCCFDNILPTITKEELEVLIHRKEIDKLNIFDFISTKNINNDIIISICKYLNNSEINENKGVEILKKISMFSHQYAEYFFDHLDFSNSIKYYLYSDENKDKIKNAYSNLFEFDTVAGVLDFISYTKYLDEDLEKQIYDKCKGNHFEEERYEKAIKLRKGPDKVSEYTIKFILSLTMMVAFDDTITDQLYKIGRIKEAIISKTLFNKKFTMEKTDNIKNIFPVYLDIFTDFNTNYTVIQCMSKCIEFLEKVKLEKDYMAFEEDRLKEMYRVTQDIPLLDKVFSQDDDFINEYFSEESFAGFDDCESEQYFAYKLSERNSVKFSYNTVKYIDSLIKNPKAKEVFKAACDN